MSPVVLGLLDLWPYIAAFAFGALMAPAAPRPEAGGRRRGHLRVLPDPSE